MKKFKFLNLITLLLMFAAAIFVMPSCDDDDDGGDPILVEDGFYVVGAVTALPELDVNGLMAVTRNEVTQENRASLYELYIAVEAGAAGFNIVEVAGQTKMTYGPGADFVSDTTEWERDEPDTLMHRGSYIETDEVFTVPVSGLYHVIIDTDLGQVVILPVEWGIIGGATANGWGGSTVMDRSAFSLTTMTWSLTDAVLRGGEWKFRYSEGWKIDLDTVLDLGGGDVGVKVNTNFGGAVDALVPGGGNINVTDPGTYDITLVWTLGEGYSATLIRTGDLPLTDWTGVVLDVVGNGISADNTDAIIDPSTWGWGHVVLPDGAGTPTKVGDVYTWYWTTVTLEADSGFKFRTLNGIASPINGVNFDAGYPDIDTVASSSHVYKIGTSDIGVDLKAVYNLSISIDAANSDKKTITITE